MHLVPRINKPSRGSFPPPTSASYLASLFLARVRREALPPAGIHVFASAEGGGLADKAEDAAALLRRRRRWRPGITAGSLWWGVLEIFEIEKPRSEVATRPCSSLSYKGQEEAIDVVPRCVLRGLWGEAGGWEKWSGWSWDEVIGFLFKCVVCLERLSELGRAVV